ncbi:MAG: SDR family NAD(P)-dependent oxidoreductase [Alphaproteobacteria bacterium]
MPYTPFDLTGKCALITGGNRGIGLGMADAIAQAGAAVAIWGTDPKANDDARQRLEAHGGKVVVLACDIADEKAVTEGFAETVAKLGKVDACFANAGVSTNRRLATGFAEMSADEWRRVMRVNMDGTFFTLRAAAKHMIERGKGGSIAVTSSLAAVMGQARGEHYGATKAGMIAMAQAIATEYGRYGIRANAILPGWIETRLTEKAFAWDKFRDAVLPRVPLRRWGKIEDFGGIAVYLVSDASAYHSGDTFVIDGAYRIF